MKNIINSVKGTREFYPNDMAIRQWLYQNIREVSELFGYQEYDGPFLESIELYAAKSGDELVKEQSFVFPDRGGNLIALRPELTPSLARMIAKKQNQLYYPLRWWSFGPFWRYEQPQKGRTREFFQWNIDLIGLDTPEADAELVAICAEFFKRIGLYPGQVKIFVNDRRLMEQQITKLGISGELRGKVLRIIDKRDKLNRADWKKYVLEEGFTSEQFDGIQGLLKNRDLYKTSPELIRFFSVLDAMGVSEYVEYDPRIVRGLDYYTGIVFEAADVSKGSRAILGGGHYDNLVEAVGGQTLPGVGFAMGDVVLPIILRELGKLPDLDSYPANVLVTVFNQETLANSFKLASQLRAAGIKTALYPKEAKLGKQFKYADRIGTKYVLVLGPDEIEQNVVQVKNMETGDQSQIGVKSIDDHLLAELA